MTCDQVIRRLRGLQDRYGDIEVVLGAALEGGERIVDISVFDTNGGRKVWLLAEEDE